MGKQFARVRRSLTLEQKQEYDEIRRKVKEEFPPLEPPREPSAKGRIALAIRDARQAQSLTIEQLAERSGVVDVETVRNIEYGSDAKLSDVAAIGEVLGLRLELIANIS